MKVELKKLSISDGKDVFRILKLMPDEENGFYNPGAGISLYDFSVFLQMKANISKGIGLPKGYVPETIYWLYIDGEIVGVGKLRDYLTAELRQQGGHIGYAIMKEHRGKGYGNILLAALIKRGKSQGIDRFLITCKEDNISSKRMIERNNGILEEIVGGTCKYWIKA